MKKRKKYKQRNPIAEAMRKRRASSLTKIPSKKSKLKDKNIDDEVISENLET